MGSIAHALYFGVCWLYSVTGTLNFAGHETSLASACIWTTMQFNGLAMMVVGVMIKALYSHFIFAADVYTYAPST